MTDTPMRLPPLEPAAVCSQPTPAVHSQPDTVSMTQSPWSSQHGMVCLCDSEQSAVSVITDITKVHQGSDCANVTDRNIICVIIWCLHHHLVFMCKTRSDCIIVKVRVLSFD